MQKLFILLGFLLSIGTFCCAQQVGKTTDKASHAANSNADAKFVIAYNDAAQTSKITVQYGRKVIAIGDVQGQAQMLKKSEYRTKNVPGAAISCCWSWWAGTGLYYYITNTANGVAVYKGNEYEESPNKIRSWKKIKEIKK